MSGAVTDRTLPSFVAPPVFETAMAVEFAQSGPISVRDLVHVRDLWAADFPASEEHPIVPPSSLTDKGGLPFIWGNAPSAARLWALSEAGDKLLQVQDDRLVLNWRRKLDSAYPGYEYLKAIFSERWQEMNTHLEAAIGVTLIPTLAEYTYVNQVVAPDDGVWSEVLRYSHPDDSPLPGEASIMQTRMMRDLKSDGRQYGTVGIFGEWQSGNEMLDFTVVTKVEVGSRETVLRALDTAHEVGVQAFAAVTSPEAHEKWGRTK